MDKAHTTKIIHWSLLSVILVFTLLRFVNLEADFPAGVTQTGVLYTDEGWYSNNAIAHNLTGNWYVSGDFNTAVNLPIFNIFQALTFKILGLSLASARTTACLFFISFLAVIYFFVRKHSNETVALITTALISVNYVIFSFSRLALLEIPMTSFLVLSLLLISNINKNYGKFYVILSAVSFVIAILTKTMAIFALPLLLFIIWREVKTKNDRLINLAVLTSVLVICLTIYYLLLARPYSVDFKYFSTLNITSRLDLTAHTILNGIKTAIFKGRQIDKIMYALTILLGIAVFVSNKQLRKNILLPLSLLWIFLYLIMLGFNNYFPTRYYLPLIVPLMIITAILTDYLLKQDNLQLVAVVLFSAVILSVSASVFKISRYLSSPQYTYLNMTRDVKSVIDSEKGSLNVIMGHFANTVSLSTGILSLNDSLGTASLTTRLRRYLPNYYLSLGKITPENFQVMSRYYTVEKIKTYDILNNYYGGKKVFFYKITSRMM